MKMLLKTPVFSPDYKGSSLMQVRWGPWTMIQFLAVDLQRWSSSPRHERAFRRPALSLPGSPGLEGANSSSKGLKSDSLSWVLVCPGSPYMQGRPVSAACGARGQCCSSNSRHQDCSNSSLGATSSADQLLSSCKDSLNTNLGINIPRCLNSSVLLMHTTPLNTLVS